MNKRNCLLPDSLQLGHCFFLAFRLQLINIRFLGLQPPDLQTRTYTIGFPCSQAFRLELGLYYQLCCVSILPMEILGLIRLHNHVSQSVIILVTPSFSPYLSIYLSIYPSIYAISIYILWVLFLWRTLIQVYIDICIHENTTDVK